MSTTFEVDATNTVRLADDFPETTIEIPRLLSPREVVEGRVMFRVPDAMIQGRRRQRYQLAVIDAHGMVRTIRLILINEHDHAS